MKKQILGCLTLLLMAFCVQGQSDQDSIQFQLIQSEGIVPRDFTTKSSKKYERAVNRLKNAKDNSTLKKKKKFYLESNFAIDELLKSGNVLFNDPVSNYINLIADELLKDDPKLRSKLRFYTTKSSIVNAFTTDQGIIFVNMGLVAQVKNEAELAFILAHEISHYEEKHIIDFFLEEAKIDANRNTLFKASSYEERMLEKNKYSKELEVEADIHGFELFSKSNYSLEGAKTVFDVLKFSGLPYKNTKFDISFFEDKYLTFPDSLQLDTIKAIVGLDDAADDSNSTHPSLKKRKMTLDSLIQLEPKGEKQDFIVSESTFKEVQKLAKYELPNYALSNHNYYMAIYYAYLLLQQEQEPSNKQYFERIIAHALYGFAQMQSYGYNDLVMRGHQNIEGGSQPLFYLLNQMDLVDITVFATKYIWDLQKKYPDDNELKLLADGVVETLVVKHIEDREELSSQRVTEYLRTALDGHKNTKQFTTAFANALKERKKKENETERTKRKRIKAFEKMATKGGFNVGAKKVVVINPQHHVINRGRKNTSLETEKRQELFYNLIRDNAKIAKVKVKILDKEKLSKTKVDAVNDLALVNDWVSYKMALGDVKFEGYRQDEMNQLIEKYGTEHFLFIGMATDKRKVSLLSDIVTFYISPFLGVYNAIKPNRSNLFYAMLINANTGKIEMMKMNVVKTLPSKSIINAHIYDTFTQIKRKK